MRGFGIFAILCLLHGVFAAVGERVEGVHKKHGCGVLRRAEVHAQPTLKSWLR